VTSSEEIRDRASRRLVSRLWKSGVAVAIVGGCFSIVAAGGGFGGPTDGTPADGAKAIAVIEFAFTITVLLVAGFLLRYAWDVRRRKRTSQR
jgi:hypothetical protein